MFLAGLVLSYVHPVLGTVVLLVLPLMALRFSLPRGQRTLWSVVTATGLAVVLVGGPWTGLGTGRIRALAKEICSCCPGHAIQLAGWLLGLVGAGIAFVQDRAERKHQRGHSAAARGPLLAEAHREG